MVANFWHNQTYTEPDYSLAKARRGCLSLPDIGSFYAKVNKPSRQRIYGPRTLKLMLARMEKQPQRPWPSEEIWSFRELFECIWQPNAGCCFTQCFTGQGVGVLVKAQNSSSPGQMEDRLCNLPLFD